MKASWIIIAMFLAGLNPVFTESTPTTVKTTPVYSSTPQSQTIPQSSTTTPEPIVRTTAVPEVETQKPVIQAVQPAPLPIVTEPVQPTVQPQTVNGVVVHPSADQTAMQSPFSCSDGAAQLANYEELFKAKPNMLQTEEWTRYQELQVAYNQNNCKS